MNKTKALEQEMGIKMVQPFSVGDTVVIAVYTNAGPDFVNYKLMVPMENGKWWGVVTDEDNNSVPERTKTLEIEESDIQDFTDTVELEADRLAKAPVHRSISQDWDVF